MKKITLLAFMALALCACNKINEIEEQPVVPAGPNTVTFTAEFTKTATTNDQTVTWVAGDEVKFVWSGGSATVAAASSGASTSFTVNIGAAAEVVYAVYPASAGGSYDNGNVNVHFNGSRTDGSFAANDICVAKAVKNGDVWQTSLAFKNVACLFKVSVTGSGYDQIQIQGKDREEGVAGLQSVGFDGDSIALGDTTSTTRTMNLTISGPGDYYLPVLPGVTFTNGFMIKLLKSGSIVGTPFYYNGSFTTERGKILKFPDIDGHAGHYYVKPNSTGTGAGQSWNNAMSASQFKAFIEDSNNATLLRGSTFHFSANSFQFGSYLVPNFSGAFTIEGTKNGSDSTVFVGRSGDSAGILELTRTVDVTVNNVRFTGTSGNSNRAAIRVNNATANLTLENCSFDNNSTSGQSAAVNILKGTVNITDCAFRNNSASSRGASLYVEQATVNISGSIFSDNTGQGGAMYVNHASAAIVVEDSEINNHTNSAVRAEKANTIEITNTEFTGNNSGDYSGPALRFGGSTTVTVTDCDFVGNHCTSGGGTIAISSNSVTLNVTGGKFQGNYATGTSNDDSSGAVIYDWGGSTVTFKDVLFKENYNLLGENTASGGIIRANGTGSIERFDGCVFDGNYTNRSETKNTTCAAIVDCRTGGIKYYFNACEFKENTSGTSNWDGVFGGLRGTVFATLAGSTFAFNNCSFHDNYGGRSTHDISWIGMDNTSSTLILANTTIAGDNYRAPGAGGARQNNWGVIKFQNTGNFYLLNSILCSLDTSGNCFWVNGDLMLDGTTKIKDGGPKLPVYCWYCKTSKEGDGWTDWGTDTGSGHDYYATSASFGSWTMPYTWNGTLTGTNSGMLAATADVNAQIQSADADFYAWLSSIGALGKDINGNSRGATSWPGCYQSN